MPQTRVAQDDSQDGGWCEPTLRQEKAKDGATSDCVPGFGDVDVGAVEVGAALIFFLENETGGLQPNVEWLRRESPKGGLTDDDRSPQFCCQAGAGQQAGSPNERDSWRGEATECPCSHRRHR